jgi:hypothetical protein
MTYYFFFLFIFLLVNFLYLLLFLFIFFFGGLGLGYVCIRQDVLHATYERYAVHRDQNTTKQCQTEGGKNVDFYIILFELEQ